ncbi:propanediol utilization protein [Limibaculum sp. FT325]|uniref:GHMP family kinase ATP-binding protein n=1 Tax=Thermohalobaculum sediminis TaxID=2939436 RepID=UPI0020C09E08|nr:propanediol utilization protein [Limibaculum sediminis]MCL5775630.1 propanediol utilization protein [Limibaculum sediminis]
MNQKPATAVNPKPAAARVAGHLGELAQGLAAPGGPVALVTLPCPLLVTEVRYTPAPGPLRSDEAIAGKALAAARGALGFVGRGDWGGEIAIRRACPPGLGAGTSTAEALGAVRAVAAAFGARLAPEVEARLCLAAEGAVDPLMHDEAVLFASREGRVLRRLAGLPPMAVIGGFAGGPRETDPADCGFPPMQDIFDDLADALAAGDAVRLGRAATASAAANQARDPNPAWGEIRTLARAVGALGICVAHTGSAIALLLPPGADAQGLRPRLEAAGLKRILAWRI